MAEAIVELIQQRGGVMTLEDLKNHTSNMDTPISVNYRGVSRSGVIFLSSLPPLRSPFSLPPALSFCLISLLLPSSLPSLVSPHFLFFLNNKMMTGVDIWEIPPNGQGITALMALNILEGYNVREMKHNSPQYLHLLIEVC